MKEEPHKVTRQRVHAHDVTSSTKILLESEAEGGKKVMEQPHAITMRSRSSTTRSWEHEKELAEATVFELILIVKRSQRVTFPRVPGHVRMASCKWLLVAIRVATVLIYDDIEDGSRTADSKHILPSSTPAATEIDSRRLHCTLDGSILTTEDGRCEAKAASGDTHLMGASLVEVWVTGVVCGAAAPGCQSHWQRVSSFVAERQSDNWSLHDKERKTTIPAPSSMGR